MHGAAAFAIFRRQHVNSQRAQHGFKVVQSGQRCKITTLDIYVIKQKTGPELLYTSVILLSRCQERYGCRGSICDAEKQNKSEHGDTRPLFSPPPPPPSPPRTKKQLNFMEWTEKKKGNYARRFPTGQALLTEKKRLGEKIAFGRRVTSPTVSITSRLGRKYFWTMIDANRGFIIPAWYCTGYPPPPHPSPQTGPLNKLLV